MESADLHMHSGYSVDNLKISPEEFAGWIRYIIKNELPEFKALALTDHNNMVGVEPISDALKKCGLDYLEYIPGVECGFEHKGISVHVTSHFIPNEGESLEDVMHRAVAILPMLDSINSEFTRRKYGISALENVNAYMRNKLGELKNPITIAEMDAVMREDLPDYNLEKWIIGPTKVHRDEAGPTITELNHAQLAKLIYKRGWTDTHRKARDLVKRGGPLYPSSFEGYDVCRGLDEIYKSGAFASIAHPQVTVLGLCSEDLADIDKKLRESRERKEPASSEEKYAKIDEVVAEFQEFIEKELIPRGLKGIELLSCHSSLTHEKAYITQSLMMWVEDYNSRNPENKICITGGSDFHREEENRLVGRVDLLNPADTERLRRIYETRMNKSGKPRFDPETIKEMYKIINLGQRNEVQIPYSLLEDMKHRKTN